MKAFVEQVIFHNDSLASYPDRFEWIGQGRSAVVFKCKETNRVVKVFYPSCQAIAEVEADVYQRISKHDLFPEVYEAGEGYLVIEYVTGRTLYDCLVEGIPITEDMIHEVDRALQFVRSLGLNPSDTHLKNIMLTEDGRIKVIDVARFTQEEECPQWEDLKKAYYMYYQRRYFPKKYPRLFIECVIQLYRKRLLPI
ncbi:serine/threonine protein kinase [Halobacillus litoralis]|uniref:serine/threonine protein kinase n=1 Tax=Halobacillus litoralis TaxID=45668 RepID=UPI001CD26048|nr:serine/threonine protein kinase [Halobacillus litoralis]MCA0971711.1 serine/threonine protein kinase [Halobacillus litoralis]